MLETPSSGETITTVRTERTEGAGPEQQSLSSGGHSEMLTRLPLGLK